jgi:hypothetical protein
MDVYAADVQAFTTFVNKLSSKLKSKYGVTVEKGNYGGYEFLQKNSDREARMYLHMDDKLNNSGQYYVYASQTAIPKSLVDKIKTKLQHLFADVDYGTKVINYSTDKINVGSGLFADYNKAEKQIMSIADKTFA